MRHQQYFRLLSNPFVYLRYNNHHRIVNLMQCYHIDFDPDIKSIKFYINNNEWIGLHKYEDHLRPTMNECWDNLMKRLSSSHNNSSMNYFNNDTRDNKEEQELIKRLSEELKSKQEKLNSTEKSLSQQKLKILDLQKELDESTEKYKDLLVKRRNNPFSDAFDKR